MRTAIKILIMLFIGFTYVFAQTATPKINQTQKYQQLRIIQGVKSGKLTRRETSKLENQQRKIQKNKRIAKSDGFITPAERKHIRHEQNHAGKDIYRKKHNNRERK